MKKCIKREIEASLRARPEVTAVSFKSMEQAFEYFVNATDNDPLARSHVRLEDMPESFEARLRPGDWSDLPKSLAKLSGVSNVVYLRGSFWSGKADVAVALCRPDTAGERFMKAEFGEVSSRCAQHRYDASAEEKDTLYQRLRALPGVDRIYFEDREHAIRVYKYAFPESAGDPGVTESFFVKFKKGVDLRAVQAAVRNQPAVSAVAAVSS